MYWEQWDLIGEASNEDLCSQSFHKICFLNLELKESTRREDLDCVGV